MVDLLTTAAAVGTILTSAKELARSAEAVAEKIEDVDRRSELLDLMEKLQRAQLQAMDQLYRVADLEEENRVLKQQLALRTEMTVEGDVFYHQPADGKRKGPFCARCWQADEKPVLLISGDGYIEYTCPVCRSGAGWTKDLPDPEPTESF